MHKKILFSRFVKSQATVIGTVHKETAHFIHIKWHLTLVLSTARHYLIFICFPTCAKKCLCFSCAPNPTPSPPLHLKKWTVWTRDFFALLKVRNCQKGPPKFFHSLTRRSDFCPDNHFIVKWSERKGGGTYHSSHNLL